MVFAALLAIAIPSAFLYVIWSLEVYAVSRFRLLLAAFGWGLGAFAAAFVFNSLLLRANLVRFEQLALVTAPPLEELCKAGVLVLLAWRAAIRYPADGAAYGFAAGTGFAVLENLYYVVAGTGAALGVALTRVLSSSLMHACCTALVGAVVGETVHFPLRVRVTRLSLTLLLASAVHAGFNLVQFDSEGTALLLTGLAIGLGSTGAIALLVRRSLRAEGRWITRELEGRLGAGELAAVLNPAQVAQRLAEHSPVLGAERVALVQQYVALQAERGILHKTLSLTRNAGTAARLRRQLDDVEARLATLRGGMGLFTWAWLRSVLPSDESDVWLHLGKEVQRAQPVLALLTALGERSANASSPAERVALLRASPLFSTLGEEDLTDVALLLGERRLSVGDTLIRAGETSDSLYLLTRGQLVVGMTDAGGSESILRAYVAGEAFGEVGLVDGQPYPVSVTCVEDAHLYVLARADFLTLVYAKPQVALEMLRQMAGDLRRQAGLLALQGG